MILAAFLCSGCGGSDVEAARKFERFPLYWVGDKFERWKLTEVDGLDYASPIVTFIYGSCTPTGGEQPSCTPPFQVQVLRSCAKVYRGEGSYPGLERKVFRALRPLGNASRARAKDTVPLCD